MLAEYDSAAGEGGTKERWFVHGPVFPDLPLIHFHRVKGPLVMVDLTYKGQVAADEEEYLFYLKDMLGSVTALTNSDGAVVERYVYDPYGGTLVTGPNGLEWLPMAEPWPSASPGNPSRYGNSFMWTGQRCNHEVGLYHFLFRIVPPLATDPGLVGAD